MNILFLTAYPPVLNMHGGGVRMYHNIRILGRRHDVHVISFVEDDDEAERLGDVSGICASFKAIRRVPLAGRGRLSRTPPEVRGFDTPEMRSAVAEVCRRRSINVFQCEYAEMAQYRRRDVFSVWSVIDLHSPGLRRAAVAEASPLAKSRALYRWLRMTHYETRMARSFDRVVTMTPGDAEYLRGRARGADIRDIPIGVDTAFFRPRQSTPEDPLRVVFLGNFRHAPNVEAVQFLLEYIVDSFPEVRFEVAGAHLPEGLTEGTRIHNLGYQSDTRALYRSPNTIVVAPLFSGRGQRVKLLEAFSMGMPVLTTALGASGFPVHDGEHALISETPAEFRSALARLRDSPELRARMGSKARQMVLDEFEWEALADRFLEVVEPGAAAGLGAGRAGLRGQPEGK